MKTETVTNIPSLTVNEAIAQLADVYSGLISSGLPLKTMPSVMLWGPPGVGKSQGVRQLAEELRARTGLDCRVTDVRLLLFNPIDLRGIPTANADKTLAVWLKPQIFQMDESDRVLNILFLDEISAAPQSVQAAAYQITLDRVVGEHRLPDNCIVIAAGNRVTDRSVAYKMPKALANRLCHIEIETDFESWRQWAVSSGLDERVIGFLLFRRDRLMLFSGENDDLAFPTPRSWEMAARVLSFAGGDVKKVYSVIAGCVGAGTASEFRAWCEIWSTLPDIPSIFAGKEPAPPKSPDALYALISAMTAYARKHTSDSRAIANSVRYAFRLPPDFASIMLKDYMYLEPGFREKLMREPEFAKWVGKYGGLFNQ